MTFQAQLLLSPFQQFANIGYIGNSLDNTISATDGDNFIYAFDGNDTLYGNGGSDTIYGGKGNDVIYTGFQPTNSWLNLTPEDLSKDTAYGGKGDDVLYGSEGSDYLFGGEDDDELYGDDGDDVLNGGRGDDYLKGGNGTDTFVFEGEIFGHDTIGSFVPASSGGVDVIDFSGTALANNVADVSAAATSIFSGGFFQGTLLDFGPEASVMLFDVAIADLSAADFIF